MDDWQTILKSLGAGGVAVYVVGRWVVPMFRKMMDNTAASLGASGDTLRNVQMERDQWKKSYEDLAIKMENLLKDWAGMKAEHDLIVFKLDLAEKRSKDCDQHYAALQEELTQAKIRIHNLENQQ